MDKYIQRVLKINNISLDLNMWVHFNISSLVWATDKEFLLTSNYLEGKGLYFKRYMESNHPSMYLFWISNANGNWMDIVVMATLYFFQNRYYWVKFLIELLSNKETDNKLEESLCISLTSIEMVVYARGMSILYVSITNSLLYLSGNSNNFM